MRRVTCVVCGGEFGKRNNHKTCSEECSVKLKQQRVKGYSRSRSKRLTAERRRKLALCATCGKEYERANKAMFCSDACREAYRKKYMRDWLCRNPGVMRDYWLKRYRDHKVEDSARAAQRYLVKRAASFIGIHPRLYALMKLSTLQPGDSTDADRNPPPF